jgi:hypothetical protein
MGGRYLTRAIARGVTLSSNFLSGRLETDAIALHCHERYQPCGWTAPLARVVDLKTFQNQMAYPPGQRPAFQTGELWFLKLAEREFGAPPERRSPTRRVATHSGCFRCSMNNFISGVSCRPWRWRTACGWK